MRFPCACVAVVSACAVQLVAVQAHAQLATAAEETAFEKLMSSRSVLTAQESMSGRQDATMRKSSIMAATQAIASGKQAAEILRAKENFGYDTGQGYKMCDVAPGKATIGSAMADRNTYEQTTGTREDGWFATGGDKRDTLSALVGLRHSVYCSQGEKDSTGEWCDPSLGQSRGGGFPAGNSDASVWLLRRNFGAEEGMTGMDYTDTVAPLPSVPAPNSGDASQEAQRLHALYTGAFVSAGRTSLSRIILNGMDDTEQGQAPVEEGPW